MQNINKVMQNKHLVHGTIMGIPLTVTPKSGVLRYVRHQVKENKKILVVTPNPEQIMHAQKDIVFAQILKEAQVSLPDGVGLLAASALMQRHMPRNKLFKFIYGFFYGLYLGLALLFFKDKIDTPLKIIKGRDFVIDLVRLANKLGLKMYFLGSRQGVAQAAVANLAKSYKSVKLMASAAPELTIEGKPVGATDRALESQVITQINAFKPDFLIVGIAPPKQEKWLALNWERLDFKCAMVCGATIDFIAGNLPYPPKILSNLGLEWLWRLLTAFKTGKSPKRIFSAFPAFPLKVFALKMSHNN